jgi:hypothetical protein
MSNVLIKKIYFEKNTSRTVIVFVPRDFFFFFVQKKKTFRQLRKKPFFPKPDGRLER